MPGRVNKASKEISALIKQKEQYVSADQLRVLRKARAKFNKELKAYTQMLKQVADNRYDSGSQLTLNL
jgi:hypothetical protein